MKFKLPFTGSGEFLCVELGSEYLKLACVAKNGEVKHLTSLDVRPMMDEDISSFIHNYIEEKGIKTDEVISCIPARYTITKNIELPSTDPKEIKEIIKLQAGRYTPYSKDEIVIDYFPIGTYKGGYTKVLLAIVNRDVITKQIEIIEGAQLKLKKVVLSSEVTIQWFNSQFQPAKQPRGLIHFGYGTIEVMVVSDGKPTFVRSLPIGSYQLINEKEKYSDKFDDELRKSLETYQTEQISNLEEIILIGSITKLGDLEEAIKKQTELPVRSMPYLNNLTLADEARSVIDKDGGELSFLAVISSALHHQRTIIDLTPEEIKFREMMAVKSREIIVLGTLIMFVLILIGAVFALVIHKKNKELTTWKEAYETHHPAAEDLKLKKGKSAFVKNYLRKRSNPLDAITELYRQVVFRKPIWLNNVIYDTEKKEMTVRGTSYSANDIQDMVGALEKTSYFKDVTNPNSARRMVEGKEAFDFEIICPFE